MPQIRIIQSSGSIPSTTQLPLGDIAINSYDGKAYIKQASGSTQNIIELGTGGSSVSASYALSASYATTASYALNGGVTQLIAGTNVTLSPAGGTGVVTVNAVLASSGSGTPNGPIYSLQYNNGGVFSGSGNFTLLNDSDLYLTGSLRVSGSITGSLFGTSSWATNAINASTASYVVLAQSASYVLNAVSSSFASTASFVSLAQSASYVLNAVSASFATTASYSISSSFATTASYSVTSSFASNAASASFATTASYAKTGSYINPLFQSVFISGSTEITGSTTLRGDVTVNSAATIDLNATTLNINAGTFQVPSFALPYSPSANVRVVMYDAVSNALFVTASAPAGAVITNLIATGSVTASVQVGPAATVPYFFLIQSGSAEMLKINAERVVVFESRTDTPTPVTGGMYYSASGDFFLGLL